MKKLGLLAVVAMLAVSCNSKPGGNKGVVKLEHEPTTLEQVHHGAAHHGTEEHAEEGNHAEEAHAAHADSTAVKTDSVK
jgi:hypothetical protein